jgi:hypothetical protein
MFAGCLAVDHNREREKMLRSLAAMSGTRPFILVWFALDAIFALLPPVYWAASGVRPTILGLPLSVFYFVSLGLFITASLVVAYLVDDTAAPEHVVSGRDAR